MRTNEYIAYRGSARGLEEMLATGVKGANQMRPEANSAYKIASNPAKTATSATNEPFHRMRSEMLRKTEG